VATSEKHSLPSHRGLCVLEINGFADSHHRHQDRTAAWKVMRGPVASAEGMGGAQVAGFAMCASRGRPSRLAHIAKSATYAPPQPGND